MKAKLKRTLSIAGGITLSAITGCNIGFKEADNSEQPAWSHVENRAFDMSTEHTEASPISFTSKYEPCVPVTGTGRLTQNFTADIDILDRIFSQFCIGK